jgi:hypothetical protein
MFVEPLADVDMNVPGAIAMLVAPAAAQISVLLVPEFMLVGSAEKEVIVGFPAGEPGEVVAPQPARPRQANRMRANAQASAPEEPGSRVLSLFLQDPPMESIRKFLPRR